MSTLMSLEARKEMLAVVQTKYQSADWKNKHQILDGFIAATGYERKHAIKLLNNKVSPKNISNGRRGKPAYYTPEVIQVLEMLWHASNQICSKRLVPFLPELIAALERHKHLYITDDIKSRLLNISPASLDRLLHKKNPVCTRAGCPQRRQGPCLRIKLRFVPFQIGMKKFLDF